jgi:hypothetical protein
MNRTSFPVGCIACAGVALVSLRAPAELRAAGGSVTIQLTSPQDGTEVAPGTPIEWSVTASVSREGCAGLALLVVDLVQSPSNPATLDIPAASGVPPGLESFSRPLGISNPGEDGLETGYVGVLRGAPGARDLRQIGGAQNTSGVPGSSLGTNAQVVAGIGQGSPVVIASGSFSAPSVPGAYAFFLENPLANVLDEARAPPDASPVSPASGTIAPVAFTFVVTDAGPGPCESGCFIRGDCNGDGRATGNVTDAVFLLNFNFLGGREPPCLAACDANGDGKAVGSVTDAVFMLQFNFLGGAPPPPPFPDCGEGSRPTDAILGCARAPEVCR